MKRVSSSESDPNQRSVTRSRDARAGTRAGDVPHNDGASLGCLLGYDFTLALAGTGLAVAKPVARGDLITIQLAYINHGLASKNNNPFDSYASTSGGM